MYIINNITCYEDQRQEPATIPTHHRFDIHLIYTCTSYTISHVMKTKTTGNEK